MTEENSILYEKIAGKDYKDVLKYFFEVSSVPRGSDNNAEIASFLQKFAKERNIECVRDEADNIIMYKPATKGYEDKPAVMLQGHMDMVCLVDDGYVHDFFTEGLKLILDGDNLKADHTTLGADDGIAVAIGMAILADDTIPHPAIEVVITTNEETGMDGATALDASLLKSKCLINLDTEGEGYLTVGCAGGLRGAGKVSFRREEKLGRRFDIELTGLKGGHSGTEINRNCANASILMGELLSKLCVPFNLVSIEGGDKENAIPAWAKASILVAGSDGDAVKRSLAGLFFDTVNDNISRESDVHFEMKDESCDEMVIPECETRKIIDLLMLAPNGVQRMSADVEGLVETSLNLGILRTSDECVTFNYSIRSSKASGKELIADKLRRLYGVLSAEIEFGNSYPAWSFRRESAFRDLAMKVYEEQMGITPLLEIIHAGLECGLILEKMPELDIISFGADVSEIHTTAETMNIISTVRIYKVVEKILEAIQ